jgi:hypothetical protein
MTDPRTNDGPRPFPAAPDAFDESGSARFDAEIDFSAERPASTMHGPRPTKASVKWLVGGLVGGSLLLAGIISWVRGPDDDPAATPSSEVVAVRSVLAAPLEQAIIALESMRMEAITAQTVRAMGDAPPRRELARRVSPTPVTPPPASPSPTAASPGAGATPARTLTPTAVPVRDLPPPPKLDEPSEEAGAPSDEPPAAAPSGADAPAPSAPHDAAAPSQPRTADDDAPPADPGDRSTAPS